MKFRLIRYYADETQPTKDDIIARYFYSECEKAYVCEQWWYYGDMLKHSECNENGLLGTIDTLFDMIPTPRISPDGKCELYVSSVPLKYFNKGGDLDD